MKDDADENLTLQSLQARLAETQQRLDALVNGSLDAIITVGEAGKVIRWNQCAEKVFGWDASEVIGRPLIELVIPPEFHDSHAAEITQFLKNRQPKNADQRIELIALRHDKTRIHVELTVIPIQSRDGLEFTAVVRDISKQRAAQREIEDRESQLAAILHSTAEGIYGLDMDGNCTFANSACAKLLGYGSSDELLGRNMHSLIHHTKLDGTAYPSDQCPICKAFRVGIDVHVEDELFWRKDGSSFPTEYWSHPIKINEEVVGSVLTFLDISQRKKLELSQNQLRTNLEGLVGRRTADLASTRSRLELSLQAGNIGLWDWNAETNEVYFSDTYKRQLGFESDEPWNDLDAWQSRVHPDDFDAAMKRVDDYFATRTGGYKSTFRMRCKDESYRWFLAQGTASFSEDGDPLRLLGVHVDITQRMQHERDMEHLNAALERSNLELQQFAYIASHDLQTPLRAIAGFAQFLESDYGDKIDEKASGYIQRIVGGAVRMQKMIDDLLTFSRVESAAKPFDRVDMNVVFDDAIGLLFAPIEEQNATITYDDLPAVMGDSPQLVQLLQNLIGNGLKYGGETPAIHVSAERLKKTAVFSVRDHGIGISERQHKKIFEVFQRLHSRDAYPGTGIGLAVCRRIVMRHGGKIWVESAEDSGSTFKFELPLP